eukprot:4720181-Lingulodinium_polyedra.AAC.1
MERRGERARRRVAFKVAARATLRVATIRAFLFVPAGACFGSQIWGRACAVRRWCGKRAKARA